MVEHQLILHSHECPWVPYEVMLCHVRVQSTKVLEVNQIIKDGNY